MIFRVLRGQLLLYCFDEAYVVIFNYIQMKKFGFVGCGMEENIRSHKLLLLVKGVTLITASVFVIAGNGGQKMILLLLGIALYIFNSFSRQLYIYEHYGQEWMGKASILVDLGFIVFIGMHDKSQSYFLYFFFAVVSEAAAFYAAKFGFMVLALSSVSSILFPIAQSQFSLPFMQVAKNQVFLLIGFVFTYIMSLLVRMQFMERKRIERVNVELEQAYKKLLQNASMNQQLILEKERLRMAREIHDTLAHTLTAAVVQLEASKKVIDVDIDRAKEGIEKAQEITREGLHEVKRTIKALRPQALVHGTLFDALTELAADVKENFGAVIEIQKGFREATFFPSSVEVALFRVIQESVTNAVRHGHSDKVVINFSYKEDHLQVSINDNGKGCSHIAKGFGLKGISERIEAIKGKVDFDSTIGHGFATVIHIPLGGAANVN